MAVPVVKNTISGCSGLGEYLQTEFVTLWNLQICGYPLGDWKEFKILGQEMVGNGTLQG